jgi:hypothetical protein
MGANIIFGEVPNNKKLLYRSEKQSTNRSRN